MNRDDLLMLIDDDLDLADTIRNKTKAVQDTRLNILSDTIAQALTARAEYVRTRLAQPWTDPSSDAEIAESLSLMTDLQVADMLGPLVTAAYRHDPVAAAELIATFVADIRAGERVRLTK
jgi:hypothetical protein